MLKAERLLIGRELVARLEKKANKQQLKHNHLISNP